MYVHKEQARNNSYEFKSLVISQLSHNEKFNYSILLTIISSLFCEIFISFHCMYPEMESKEFKNRKKIFEFFNDNLGSSYSNIAKRINLAKSIAVLILKQYENSLSLEKTSGGDQKRGPTYVDLALKIKMSFKSKPGLSDYDRAKKFGISKSFIQKLRGNARINSYQAI